MTRVRKSIWELNEDDVTLLKKAFTGIMNYSAHPYIPLAAGVAPADRLKGYFNLASVHGVFDGRCFHGAMEFVFWHRIYIRYFEDALRSVEGCENVTLPFFDAGTIYKQIQESRKTQPKGPDPQILPAWCNEPPFNSYILPESIKDTFLNFSYVPRGQSSAVKVSDIFSSSGFNWNKGATYRDPALSGWFNRGTQYKILEQLDKAIGATTVEAFTKGLLLESPHGSIHVMTGAQAVPGSLTTKVPGWIGSVPIAAFDPVFWFHHSNIERHFKLWQQQRGATTREALEAIKGSPSFHIPWDESFKPEFDKSMSDALWEADVQYTAGYGDEPVLAFVGAAVGKNFHVSNKRTIFVNGIDRTKINGSFDFFVHFHTSEGVFSICQGFFQTGVGCEQCQEHPYLSLLRDVPPEVSFPCDISFSAQEVNGAPIENFGVPRFNIRQGIAF